MRTAKTLHKGTPCLIRSVYEPAHNGKVVVVQGYSWRTVSYRCAPQLYDAEGYELWWFRESLVPLRGGDGDDEMLRITGKPEVTSA